MAKLKAPLLSLEAHNSLANTLTYQRRHGTNFVRRKPFPGNVVTLPRQYQRWLYEDYVDWWNEQTPAVKRQYEILGSPLHLTGYQYWMRHHLRNLPDIIGYWKLDETSGAIAYDSSRNLHPGTIFGASVTNGAIAGARYFDGINDYITCGNYPQFKPTEAITVECFVKQDTPEFGRIVSKSGTDDERGWILRLTLTTLYWHIHNGTAYVTTSCPRPSLGLWHHILATYNRTSLRIYVDGVLSGTPTPETAPISYLDPSSLFIGVREGFAVAEFLRAYIDAVRILNRLPTQPSITKWSQRRFTL